MDIFKVLLSLFLLLLFLAPLISATNICPTSMCFNSSFMAQFPFQILNKHTIQHCAYPGFDLTCNNDNNTVTKFPYSGEFFVRNINYQMQEIQLYDPSNCLPRRLMDLNLSGTPFKASFYRSYTFIVCPRDFTQPRYTVIECLSNSTNTTLATSLRSLVGVLPMCQVLFTMPIPVSLAMQDDSSLSSGLNGDLQLYWDVPNCEDCEMQGATCGFGNNTSQEVVCFDSPGSSGTADNLRVLKMITVSIAIPTVTCGICAVCICLFLGCHGHRTAGNFINSAALTPNTAVTSGLDQSTIESYTKVVLGESRRLPVGPNDGTCSICLSDYRAEETVRCIPECQHCFHADCIDEWLRLNMTCPVCRNTPSPAHDNLQPV